jgi:gamma-glutamylputrescine oxidase
MSLLRVDQDLAQQSWYSASAARTQAFAPLAQNLSCDVAVVGAGLAGLSAALELAERGLTVVLLEARQVGSGASGRNGGQAIHGLACDQSIIEAQLGLADAQRVWAMSLQAVAMLRERCQRYAIDCDWQAGYLGVATSARKGAALHAWVERMARVYGTSFTPISASQLPQWIASPRYHSGFFDPHSGHLHPLKYSLGLASAAARAGVQIYENSPVTLIEPASHAGQPVRLHTAGGQVSAGQVLLAGNVYLPAWQNGPQAEGVRRLAARVMPVGTYIVATEPMATERAQCLIPSLAAVCDSNFVLDYLRFAADRLPGGAPAQRMLYGGRVSYSTVTPPRLAQSMRQRMLGTFPQLQGLGVSHAWGGFVDISMNRAPDFGRIAANLYYLQGFSGHGLALTGLAGRLVAEAMSADAGRFDVFARLKHRAFPGGAWLRTPALVLGMAWYRLRDLLG